MRHKAGTTEKPAFDFKAAGYIVSIFSVFLLGAVAWPKPDDPPWLLPVLLIGMGTSIAGMALRYVSHLKQKKELKQARAEARRH